MFVVESILYGNGFDDGETSVKQEQFDTIDMAINYLKKMLVPCYIEGNDKLRIMNSECNIELDPEESFQLSDDFLITYENMLNHLQLGNKIILQENRADGTTYNVFSHQIINIDDMKLTYILNKYDEANCIITQISFESKSIAVDYIMNSILNVDKDFAFIESDGCCNNRYVDIKNGHIYTHYVPTNCRSKLKYNEYNILLSPTNLENNIEPTNFDKLRQWFYDGKECSLDWSDRASTSIKIEDIYVPVEKTLSLPTAII